jgi:hypothetical protein
MSRGSVGEEMKLLDKEFWQTCAKALADWAKTARMCVLITVTSLNLALIYWLLRH